MIFEKYSKDFSVENNCINYFYELHLKDSSSDNILTKKFSNNDDEYLNSEENVNNLNKSGKNYLIKEIKEILENLCFLNKDEMVVFKDFKTEFLKEVLLY